MVALPLSYRRPASTLIIAKYHNVQGVLQGARSNRKSIIDPSIHSRSMDPGLAAWGLPSSEEISIITWGTISLLLLLIVMSVRTMVATRTFRRRRTPYLRDMEQAAIHMCPGGQQRVRAALKIGVNLGDSSVDLMVSLFPSKPFSQTKTLPESFSRTTSRHRRTSILQRCSYTFRFLLLFFPAIGCLCDFGWTTSRPSSVEQQRIY